MPNEEIALSVSESFTTEVFRLSPDRKTIQVFACTISAEKAYNICRELTAYLEDAEPPETVIKEK